MSNLSNSDTFCYHAMQSYSTHPHGRSRPCCFSRQETRRFMPGINFQDTPEYNDKVNAAQNISEFINDPEIMKIRDELLKGKQPKGCAECFKLEKDGIRSFRQTSNEIYEEHINQSLENVSDGGWLNPKAITYLDISLGNICNLKCRSCNPWASHRWIEEGPTVPHTDWDETAYKIGKISSVDPWFVKAFEENFFDEVLPNVKIINFIGGEPLVVKEHYVWLEHIIEMGWASNIELHYNTNGTTIPDNLLEIWDKFKGIVLSLSIDAIDDLAYYVRYPSKWKLIKRNIEKLKVFSKTRTGVVVHTHVTLSVMNLHDLPNILDWCKENYDTWHYEWDWGNHGYQNCLPHFNIVEYPRHQHIRNLPEDRKVLMHKMLEEQHSKFQNLGIPDWEQWAIDAILGLKNQLDEEPNDGDWKRFINNTRASDKFRKVDILNYIPWMEEHM